MDTKIDMMSFQILKNTREAKELAYKALKRAKEGNLDQAKKLLEACDSCTERAEEAQNELLSFEMCDRPYLKEHSRDHLLSSMIARDLVQDVVLQYEAKLN